MKEINLYQAGTNILQSTYYLDNNGKLQGKCIFFNEDGSKRLLAHYKNGTYSGLLYSYITGLSEYYL